MYELADDTFYVYTHVDPETDELLYVGMGQKHRAWVSTKAGGGRSTAHESHLNDLFNRGYVPSDWVRIVERKLTKLEAERAESSLIHSSSPRYNVSKGVGGQKVTREMYRSMVDLRSKGMYYREIASVLGVSANTVSRTLRGETGVADTLHETPGPTTGRPKSMKANKFTVGMYDQARKMREEGLSYPTISKHMGVNMRSLYRALNGQNKALNYQLEEARCSTL